jgi:hypothetical protein
VLHSSLGSHCLNDIVDIVDTYKKLNYLVITSKHMLFSELFILNSSFVLLLLIVITGLLFSLYMYKLSIEPVVVTEKPFELKKFVPIVIEPPTPPPLKPIIFDYSIPTCTKYDGDTTDNRTLVTPSPGYTIIYPVGRNGFLLSTVVPESSKASFYF